MADKKVTMRISRPLPVFLRPRHQMRLPPEAAAAAGIALDEIVHDQFALAFVKALIDEFLHDAVGDPLPDLLLGLIGPKLRFWPTRRTIKEHYCLLCA